MSTSFPRGFDSSSANAKPTVKRTLAQDSVPIKKKPKKNDDVDTLSFGKLSLGCAMLGFVLKIQESSLLVSLPGGFTGVVHFNEISDMSKNLPQASLSAMEWGIHPMQIVKCCIIGYHVKADRRKIILLSMRASLLNKGLAFKHLAVGFPLYGAVASIEDHGYVISTGIAGLTCFLPRNTGKRGVETELKTGQLIDSVISSVNDISRTVTVKSQHKALRDSVIIGSTLTLNALCPGMLFSVTVDEITDNGMVVSFLGLFFGVIDKFSMEDLTETPTVGDVLRARVIFVDLANKIVRFSTKPHIISLRSPVDMPPLGSVLHNIRIVEVFKKHGVLLLRNDKEMFERGDPAHVFIHKSCLSDLNGSNSSVIDVDKMSVTYKKGAIISSAKVKGYNLVEGWILASNIDEYVLETVLHATDVQVGQILNVVVSAIKDFGLVLKIGRLNDGVSAICPTFHTADIVVDGKLKKKFKIGQQCTMRVWEVSGNSIIMTNKKTMVDMDSSFMIKSYEEAIVGKVSGGVISKISSREGITVHFFNKVKGILATGVLVKQGVTNPNDSYRVGQIVDVVVVRRVNLPSEKKANKHSSHILYLGLNMNVSADALVEMFKDVHFTSQIGNPIKSALINEQDRSIESCERIEIVSGIVTSVESNSSTYQVLLDDGRSAKIEKAHFFDFAVSAQFCEILVGHRIQKAVILSEHKGQLYITCKPLLVHAAQNARDEEPSESFEKFKIPQRIDDLTPGEIVIGFICKVESYGVIVKFRNNFTGLAPRPNLSDKFVSNPLAKFSVNDSVRCAIQRVDLVKGRALLTFKSSILTPSVEPLSFLGSYFNELFHRSKELNATITNLLKFLQTYPLSGVVKATVSTIEAYGVVFLGDANIIIVAHDVGEEYSRKLKVGSVVDICLVDIDYENGALVGSLDSTLLNRRNLNNSRDLSTRCDHAVEEAKSQARIILIKDTYLVVVTKDGVLGFVSIADFHNPKPDTSEYKILDLVCVQKLSILTEKNGNSMYPQCGLTLFTMHQDFTSIDNRKIVAKVQQEATDNDNMLHQRLSADKISEGDDSLSVLTLRQKFFDSLRVGYLTKWVVTDVRDHEVIVVPEGNEVMNVNVTAKIHITGAINLSNTDDTLLDTLDSISSSKSSVSEFHPFHTFKVGKKVWCYILQIRRREKVITSIADVVPEQQEEIMVYLSVALKKNTPAVADGGKPLKNDFLPFVKMLQSHGKDGVKGSSLIAGVITKITDLGCIVAFSPYLSGFLNFADVASDLSVTKQFKSVCFVGMKVVVVAVSVSNGKDGNNLKISRLVSELGALNPVLTSHNVGETVVGVLNLSSFRLPKPPAIMINLSGGRFGRVCVTEISDSDDWEDISAVFSSSSSLIMCNGRKHGDIVLCKILSTDGKFIEVSLRPSRLNEMNAETSVALDADPIEGSLVKGFVANISPKGCFVRVSRFLTAQVLMKDLSDSFVANPNDQFPVGKLVVGRLLTISHVNSFARLSLRRSVVDDKSLDVSPVQLIVGGCVSGRVIRITDFGVFIKIEDTEIVGLARKLAAVDDENISLSEVYTVGNLVKVKVLSVSGSKLALGLRDHYFVHGADEEMQVDNEELVSPSDNSFDKKDVLQEADKEYFPDKSFVEMKETNNTFVKSVSTSASLNLCWGDFQFETEAQPVAEMSDEEVSPIVGRGRSSDNLKRKLENTIRTKEVLQSGRQQIPRTIEDFEKLIISEPNSSFVWIHYMSFYLESSDVVSCRNVASRALKTIHYREEDEKFNVWMALINMEHKYGTMESLEEIFNKAVSESKAKKVFLSLAETYQKAMDYAGAQALFDKALKRPLLRKSKKVWNAYLQFKIQIGEVKESKEQLSRALQSLSRHKHIDVISKYALAELDYGSPERGRAVFDELLNNYPKRTDLWHILVDKEVKLGNIQQARQLYERMISSKASARNLKLIFKKYLTFELQFGNSDSQEQVKQKARDYVSNIV